MLRLCWHVSRNGSGRLHRGATSLPRSIDFSLSVANLVQLPRHVTSWLASKMRATDCGKRIYLMLSGWFLSSSGLFHTRLFCGMFVSHTRGRLGACVCVYMYWSKLHVYVYILQVYTHGVDMCVDRCCTRSSHVSGHIFIYIHAGFTCIYLRICAQSSHAWVYIYTYTPKVYMCMCIYYVYTHRVHMCACI